MRGVTADNREISLKKFNSVSIFLDVILSCIKVKTKEVKKAK